MSDWIITAEQKPARYQLVEISDDGNTMDGEAEYTDNRHCMMAGVAGGCGYFSDDGFATTGSEGEDKGLILDAPMYWRPKPLR